MTATVSSRNIQDSFNSAIQKKIQGLTFTTEWTREFLHLIISPIPVWAWHLVLGAPADSIPILLFPAGYQTWLLIRSCSVFWSASRRPLCSCTSSQDHWQIIFDLSSGLVRAGHGTWMEQSFVLEIFYLGAGVFHWKRAAGLLAETVHGPQLVFITTIPWRSVLQSFSVMGMKIAITTWVTAFS